MLPFFVLERLYPLGVLQKNFKALEKSFEQRVQSQLQQARHKWDQHLNIIDWEHEESSFTTDFVRLVIWPGISGQMGM